MSAQFAPLAVDSRRLMRWLPVLIGLTAVLAPTWVRLWNGLWNQEAYEHGPLVLAVCVWLVWNKREALAALPERPAWWAGSLVLCGGLFVYFIGRSQNLALLEVGAHLPILAGTLLLMYGWGALRVLWFTFVFLLFVVPMPAFVMVMITSQLKERVSMIAELMLYHVGYPIARDGVIISIGQYRMLVADACSGLNSMYSLSAMGLLYMYLMQRRSLMHNAVLLLSILPIAFAANIVRVMALILITYHFGDEAGQGFLHGAAGIVLFMSALVALFALDQLLARMWRAPTTDPMGGTHA